MIRKDPNSSYQNKIYSYVYIKTDTRMTQQVERF